jgi:hypothetical protein
VGINTLTPLASIDLRGNPVAGGTLSIASVSGKTSFASLVVNNDGVGDLFTASASGWTRFVIKNDGSVGIGVSNPNNLFQVAGLINFDNSRDLTALGYQAGLNNSTGGDNSFVGYQAGLNNSIGQDNSFFGSLAGKANSTGSDNSYFGYAAGANSSTGFNNSFFGSQAGSSNTYGTNNTFVGNLSGANNTVGGLNTILGANANLQNLNLINATAIGANGYVAQNNSLVLGSIMGINSATGSARIGIGTVTPSVTLDVLGFTTLNSGTLAVASISGKTSYASLIVNNDGVGDLLSASSSGWTRFAVTSAGAIKLSSGVGLLGQCLQSSGSLSLSSVWGACGGGGGGAFTELAGTIVPLNSTEDFLFGSQASVSARFKLTANNTGAGTLSVASISGRTSFATLVSNNDGIGDLFTASASGWTRFRIDNNGNIFQNGNLNFAGTNNIAQIQTLTNQHLSLNSGGLGFIGINTDGQAPLANFDIRANINTLAVASISGNTPFATLVINNNSPTGDLIAASSSSISRFRVTQNGSIDTYGTASVAGAITFKTNGGNQIQASSNQGLTFGGNTTGAITLLPYNGTGVVTIGNTTNGLTFDISNGGPQYFGSARPTKTIHMYPEYAGAVLTASGSATTNGTMTSDASPSANFKNYYEWSSNQSVLQDYTVAVQFTLPNDFSGWTTNDAITIDFNTATTNASQNKFDLIIYNANAASPTTPVVMRTANVSSVAKTWQTLTIPGSALSGWATAGHYGIFYIKMYAGSPGYIQVGDLDISYLSKY